MRTFEPILYDNRFLSESHSRFICAYSDSKTTSRRYTSISYGISDCFNNSNDNFGMIVDDFLSFEELQEAKCNYWQGYALCDICTQKQQEVLYMLLVENIPRRIIAEKLDVNKKTIVYHIKSISKKYNKMKAGKQNGEF